MRAIIKAIQYNMEGHMGLGLKCVSTYFEYTHFI